MSSRATLPFESARICISTECTFYFLIPKHDLRYISLPANHRTAAAYLDTELSVDLTFAVEQRDELVALAGHSFQLGPRQFQRQLYTLHLTRPHRSAPLVLKLSRFRRAGVQPPASTSAPPLYWTQSLYPAQVSKAIN